MRELDWPLSKAGESCKDGTIMTAISLLHGSFDSSLTKALFSMLLEIQGCQMVTGVLIPLDTPDNSSLALLWHCTLEEVILALPFACHVIADGDLGMEKSIDWGAPAGLEAF